MNETDPTKPISDIQKDILGLIDEYIEIGGSQYLVSKELQLQWLISGKSGYESTKSILAISEPHSNAEAQFSLFKGLEIFFRDNSELVGKTIFLAEGFPANEPISIRPLIEVDPNPDDDLIRKTLGSFLITGYMAYEWKHQQGIPIVGTENQELYEISKDLATICTENPNIPIAGVLTKTETEIRQFWIPALAVWKFIINARNKSIATTLINRANAFENPILFVGGGHLGERMDDSDFEQIKEIAVPGIGGTLGEYAGRVNFAELENHSIHYYLQQEKIGYTFIVPFGLNKKREEMRYQRLFKAQLGRSTRPQTGVNYEGYLNWLFEQRRVKSGKTTTVTPSPEAAAEYVRRLKEQQEENGGVIYEDHSRIDDYWFSTSREKVREVLDKNTIWGQSIEDQGRDYEKLREASLGSNCPHIDDYVFQAETVTSMKTLDLTLKSYQDVGLIDSTVRGYIDDLSAFNELSWTDKTRGVHYHFKRDENFQDRYLELAIPLGRATQAQVEKILEMQDYAQERDITLVINEVP